MESPACFVCGSTEAVCACVKCFQSKNSEQEAFGRAWAEQLKNEKATHAKERAELLAHLHSVRLELAYMENRARTAEKDAEALKYAYDFHTCCCCGNCETY